MKFLHCFRIPINFASGEYKPWFRLQASLNSYYEIARDLNNKDAYRLSEVQLWNEELPRITTFKPTTPFPTSHPIIGERYTANDNQPYKTATWAMLSIVIALIILCVFLCCLLISSKRKREFKAEPDVYH